MLVIKIELHSAITGRITTIGQMVIDNIGGTTSRGDYRARTFRKGQNIYEAIPAGKKPLREGRVENYPRLSAPVWELVGKALKSMGYV